MNYLSKEDFVKIDTRHNYNNIYRDSLEPIINGHCDGVSFNYKERNYTNPWSAVKSIKQSIKKYSYIELDCRTFNDMVYVYRKDSWNES